MNRIPREKDRFGGCLFTIRKIFGFFKEAFLKDYICVFIDGTMKLHERVTKTLRDLKARGEIGPILPFDINAVNPAVMDFTAGNEALARIDLTDVEELTIYISDELRKNRTNVGVGGYGEERTVYLASDLFTKDGDPRTVHLGIDIWTQAGTPLLSPLPAVVHSFANNQNYLDYGPTIIFQHEIDGVLFYTLHGHLTLDSLEDLEPGQSIAKGQQFAQIGSYPTNGGWPPHLHYQLITDMKGKKGDFPGVCSIKEKMVSLEISLDPNLILGIKKLESYD